MMRKILNLLFFCFCFYQAYAQTPGGIGNVEIEYWLSADQMGNLDFNDGQDVLFWKDYSGKNRDFENTNGLSPRYLMSFMNYHNAVDFYYDQSLENVSHNNRRKLTSVNNFSLDTGKAYYVIYVSRLENNNYTSGSNITSVFSLLGGSNANFGWIAGTGGNGKKLWHQTRSTAYINSNLTEQYGIGIVQIPNTSSGQAQQQILNALPSSTSMAPRQISTSSVNALSIIGASNAGGSSDSNNFYGQIMEIIVLSRAAGSVLNTQELEKINSALALKYGIPLSEQQNQYVLSDGTVVFDRSNSGYSSYKKDVFGIARDDASGLYQKQSTSAQDNTLAVSLGEFMDTNKENTSVLENKQAIVFGTNGLLGTSAYNHSNGTSFLNYTLGSGPGGTQSLTDRYNKVYRAKTTGKTSFTLEVSSGMGDWLLVGSSANFDPSQTRIYNIAQGLSKEVIINDGDFIGFAFTKQNFIGGIGNVAVEFWLSADNTGLSNLQDGSAVSSWLDKSGQTRDFINTTGSTPRYNTSAMNFHPSVEFYKDDETSVLANNTRKLQTRENFTAYADRSYFAIYVSRLDNDSYTGTDSKASVFSLNAQASMGWVAGTNNNATKISYVNDAMSNFTSEGYGISIYSIPNKSGNSATSPQMFLNGLRSTASLSKTVLKNTPDLSIIGSSNANNSAANPFFGEVMEVILISRPGGSNGVELSPEELNKLNSHLAIKYGITLDSSQNQYVLSDNTTIYDMQNQGYSGYTKDIVGIARDDQGGLYQKQSKNSSNASLAISKGEFQETNQENRSVLQDKTALVLGANGQEGKLAYSHPVGTSFANYTFQVYTDPRTGVVHQEKLTSIFSYKMRAKVTGKSSYTINARIGLGSWLVVSSDINFAPSQTRIYKPEDGEIRNVLINDGDYIGFAFDAVAPGGVFEGLRMWLNASQDQTISTNSKGEVTNWSDYAGNGTSYRRKPANKSAPLYLQYEERTNFHPTPLFRSRKDYLITDKAAMSVASPENVSFYAVVNHNFATDRSYFIGFGDQRHSTNARRPAFGVYRGSASNTDGFGRIGSTGLTISPGRLFTTGATTIAGYHWNVGTDITFEFDGGHSETTKHAHKKVLMNGPGMLGLGSSSETYYLQGVMPEAILYERQLNENEKTRINSYLGLKYAITIDLDKNSTTKNFDYLLSNNQSIWNGDDAIHRNYHNNVTSVVRDDSAGLYNKQAKSTNVGSMLHMGVGSKLGTEPELGNILVDRSAITWGHNNAELTTTNIGDLADICGVFDSRLSGRVWLVDNTNFDQSILVQAGGVSFPYDGPSWDVSMLVADSPDKISQNSWDAAIPMSFQDGVHKTNYKFGKDKVTYISFAAKSKQSHCIPCEFQGVKTLLFTNQNWPRGSKSNTYDLGDQFQATVNVSIESPSSFYSNYPRAFSYNSLRQLRTRKAGTNKMTTEIVLTQNGAGVSAQASFEIFDIDRSGNRFEHVEVYGLCSDGKVAPVLSYVQTEQRSSYTIQDNKAIGNKKYSGYTSKDGRMYVEFDTPVEKIYVVQTYTGAPNTGSSSLGIGPIEFTCEPLPPAPNEEGLVFTKQAPLEVSLCDEVSFTFRVTNINCFDYSVNFEDVLPEGMKWVEESLSVEASALQGATVNDYKDSNTLDINGLVVAGSSTLTFRARAVFDRDALPGIYENQAQLDYSSHLDPSQTKELLSCDRFQQECSPTITNATGDPDFRPLPMEVVDFSFPVLCYSPQEEMQLSLTVNNPNDFDIDKMSLSIDFNQGFSFVANSLSSSTLDLSSSILDNSEPGMVMISDFDIPSGEHTIYIKIKSPNLEDVQMQDIDPSNPSLGKKPMDLYLNYEFLSESLDSCLSQTTKDAFGSESLPYCEVCYYEPVEGDSGNIFQEDAFFGVSSLNRPDSSWMSTRSNAFVVLESTTKGFVVTRLTNTQMESLSPVEGMLIYNTTLECLMLYNGQKWGCLEQACVDE
ncbi:hypothetical protein ACYSNX_09975 [Myroides sp. LJL115]